MLSAKWRPFCHGLNVLSKVMANLQDITCIKDNPVHWHINALSDLNVLY